MESERRTELERWILDQVGGSAVRFERSPARREGWYVEVEDGEGGKRAFFLRIGRDADPANDPRATRLEAEINRALAFFGVRVPRVYGVSPDGLAVLYERAPGRSDLETADPERQQAIYRDYMHQLAALHRLDASRIELPGLRRPRSAEACALAELERVEADFAALVREPLATFGLQWLRRHVPHRVDRISFVHGDAGTPNFLFDGDRVSALIDWEWAHFGDPMEDLGNAVIHASFHPSGDWPELLDCYAEASGLPVDLERVRYYRAHLMVRSVLALAAANARWDPHAPVALNLCYGVVSDRICCDALAAAMGIELERPELPPLPAGATSLYGVVAEQLRRDVRPAVADAFAGHRLDHAALLVLALEREHRLGPAVAEIEVDDLAKLLGRRPADLATGLADLDRAIPDFGPEREEEVLRYLGRRAWRTEQLLAPVVSLFPDRALRPLERA